MSQKLIELQPNDALVKAFAAGVINNQQGARTSATSLAPWRKLGFVPRDKRRFDVFVRMVSATLQDDVDTIRQLTLPKVPSGLISSRDRSVVAGIPKKVTTAFTHQVVFACIEVWRLLNFCDRITQLPSVLPALVEQYHQYGSLTNAPVKAAYPFSLDTLLSPGFNLAKCDTRERRIELYQLAFAITFALHYTGATVFLSSNNNLCINYRRSFSTHCNSKKDVAQSKNRIVLEIGNVERERTMEDGQFVGSDFARTAQHLFRGGLVAEQSKSFQENVDRSLRYIHESFLRLEQVHELIDIIETGQSQGQTFNGPYFIDRFNLTPNKLNKLINLALYMQTIDEVTLSLALGKTDITRRLNKKSVINDNMSQSPVVKVSYENRLLIATRLADKAIGKKSAVSDVVEKGVDDLERIVNDIIKRHFDMLALKERSEAINQELNKRQPLVAMVEDMIHRSRKAKVTPDQESS